MSLQRRVLETVVGSWVCLVLLCRLPAHSQFSWEAGEHVFIWTSYRALLISCLPHDLGVYAVGFHVSWCPLHTLSSLPINRYFFHSALFIAAVSPTSLAANHRPLTSPSAASRVSRSGCSLRCVCLSGAEATQASGVPTLCLTLLVCCLFSSS